MTLGSVPGAATKTIPSAPRTFEDILPWPELLLQARELEDSLDDTLHLYDNISFTYTPNLAISSAADECEVRGAFVANMQSINDAANILGIGAECIGGGSGRSLSFTDLVVRKRTHSSNNKHFSSLVLGVGEVKGAWQLDMQPGDKLEELLRDPKRIDSCVLALQQACPSAFDATSVLATCTVHIFLHTSSLKLIWLVVPANYTCLQGLGM